MKKFYSILLLSISLFFFTNVSFASSSTIENTINEFINKTKCSSINTFVYDNGKVNYYGNENQDSVYQIGSLTKAFTGLGIMKLLNDNNIPLDNNISLYVKDFKVYYNKNEEHITILQLLTHKSGFTNSEKTYPTPKEGISLYSWVNEVSGSTLQFKPGSQQSYSNINYNLLGYLIEVLSGKSYKEYMEQEILIPLKLNDTYVGKPDKNINIIKGSRLGYFNTFNFETEVKGASIPSGYFYSSINDMKRWIEIWLGQADIPNYFKKLIDEIKGYITKENSYFAGIEYINDNVLGHSGGTAGYSSRLLFSLNEGVGVCVLCNLNVSSSTNSLGDCLLDITLGNTPNDISTDIWIIFDKIFSFITILGIISILFIILFIKRFKLSFFLEIILSIIFISLFIIIPFIFQSNWYTILYIWAPWSMLGGFTILVCIWIVLLYKIVRWKINENHYKRGF